MPDQPPLLRYPDPPLTDGVVVLRRWARDDLGCVEDAAQDPDIPKGTTVPATFTPAEGLAWIERQWSRHDDGTGLSQAIADVVSNEALGAGVLMARKPGTVEIGYWLIPRDALRTYESARMRAPVLEPLVTAFKAGLAFFWLVESVNWRQRSCIAVPRPVLHLHDGRLHRSDGPAVEWPSGTSYWFWEGLNIPRRAAAHASERARLQVLVRTPNLEKRRLLLDRMGYERFLDIAGATLHQQDDYGKLWRTTLSVDGEPLAVVEVANATPQADSTQRRYFLRVPPTTRTAREAVAWTFAFSDASDYSPAIET